MELSAATVIQSVGFVVGLVAASVYIKSALVKQRHEELENLAETRGERVGDLEAKVQELRDEVSELRGEIRAVYQLKAEEIAEAVVVKMKLSQ
jgi:TolA-binding protein